MRPWSAWVPALLVAAALAPTAAGDWPMFHNDYRHTGYQPGTVYKPYKDKWWELRAPGNSSIEASPVVADGVLIEGDWGVATPGKDNRPGQIRARDAASGAVLWTYPMRDRVVAAAAIDAKRVYAVDVQGDLVALDLKQGAINGIPLASAHVGPTQAAPTVHEGKLFIGDDNGVMWAFETQTLLPWWTFRVDTVGKPQVSPGSTTCAVDHRAGAIRGTPVVYHSTVIFASANTYVYAVEEEKQPDQSTRLLWIYKTDDGILASPAIDTDNNRVVIGSYDGNVSALPLDTSGGTGACSTANGKYVAAGVLTASWKSATPGYAQVRASPAVDNERVYYGTNTGKVVAIDSDDGAALWEFQTGDVVLSSPAVSNGIVVVGSEDRNVYWLNAETGSQLAVFAAQGPVKGSPAIDGNRTFVTSFDGSVYMFGPEIPKRPDLVVTTLQATPSGVAITVKNDGDAESGNTTVTVLVAGTTAGTQPVGRLQPGQSVTVNQAATLAPGATSLVKAIVDPDGKVQEKSDSNNELQVGLVGIAPDTGSQGGGDTGGAKKGGGGIKVPGLALPALLAGLGAALAVARRRR